MFQKKPQCLGLGGDRVAFTNVNKSSTDEPRAAGSVVNEAVNKLR